MNERGGIYPFTALLSLIIFGLVISHIYMYQTDAAIYKEMEEIETVHGLIGMSVLLVEREDYFDTDQTEWNFHFNRGDVRLTVLERIEARVHLSFYCTSPGGATFSLELWYDRTNKKWYKI